MIDEENIPLAQTMEYYIHRVVKPFQAQYTKLKKDDFMIFRGNALVKMDPALQKKKTDQYHTVLAVVDEGRFLKDSFIALLELTEAYLDDDCLENREDLGLFIHRFKKK
jgi:hypothetical protein